MGIQTLELEQFRCFQKTQLEFLQSVNLIHGRNASGKTSLLEAIHFLSRGRSFRTARSDTLIKQGSERFRLIAKITDADGHQVPLGMERSQKGLEMRLRGEAAKSLSVVAEAFPVITVAADVSRLVTEGPGARRRFLDWGVFHVEHGFADSWRRYQRALRQRNELLKRPADQSQLAAWDQEIVETGLKVDEYRRSYLSKLIAEVTPLAEESFPGAGVNFSYKQGWPLEKTLEEALSDNLERDRILGATQAGPHRADVTIEFEGAKAQDRVSRGQQKLLAGILWMAQNGVFQRETSRRCCFLVDDLPAELDTDRQSLFLDLLLRQDAQLVLTAISPEELPHPKLKGMGMFHVEQGEVKPVGA